MTLAELKTLVETMQNLPCVMSQLEEVQVRNFYLSKGCDETYNFFFFPSGTKDEHTGKMTALTAHHRNLTVSITHR